MIWMYDYLEPTFNKSAATSLNAFIEEQGQGLNWHIVSDYAVANDNKTNDVIQFTLMPTFTRLDEMMEDIRKAAPNDIKRVRKVPAAFIELLKSMPLFHVTFLFSKDRRIFRNATATEQKENIQAYVAHLREMFDVWSANTPKQAEYYKNMSKKMEKILEYLKRNSPNLKVLNDIFLVSFLASYLAFYLTKLGAPAKIIWMSDRDSIKTMFPAVGDKLFDAIHHTLCDNFAKGCPMPQLYAAVPEESGRMWYDELNRIPDYLAGTFADYKWIENCVSHQKFATMLKDYIVDNERVAVIHCELSEHWQASRINLRRTVPGAAIDVPLCAEIAP